MASTPNAFSSLAKAITVLASANHFRASLTAADMQLSEAEYLDALASHIKAKGELPEMSNDTLARDYPVLYQSLLQLVHTTGERVNTLANSDRIGKNSL